VQGQDARYERVCAPEIQAHLAQASDATDRDVLETLKDGAWLIAYVTDTSLDEQLKEVAKETSDDEKYFLLKARRAKRAQCCSEVVHLVLRRQRVTCITCHRS
jgi:hypothetical protein